MLPGRQLPLFRLPAPHDDVGPDAWWQRREMLVALLHARCPACAAARELLAARAAALHARGAGIVALAMGGPGEESALAARVARSLALPSGEAFVVVADRYADTAAILPAHGDAVIDEAERWMDHLQHQCPECGAPDWPIGA